MRGREAGRAFLAGGRPLRWHALRPGGTARLPEQRGEARLRGAIPTSDGVCDPDRGKRGNNQHEGVCGDHPLSLTASAVGGNPPNGDNSSPPMGGSHSTVRN